MGLRRTQRQVLVMVGAGDALSRHRLDGRLRATQAIYGRHSLTADPETTLGEEVDGY